MALQSLIRSRYQGDFLQVVGFYTYATPLSERQLLSSAPKPVSIYDPPRPSANQPRPAATVRSGAFHEHPRRAAIRPAHPAAESGPEQADHHRHRRRTDRPYRGPRDRADLSAGRVDGPPHPGRSEALLRRGADDLQLRADRGLLLLWGWSNFVERLAQVTQGVAAFCNADDLGNMVLESFVGGRKRRRAM